MPPLFVSTFDRYFIAIALARSLTRSLNGKSSRFTDCSQGLTSLPNAGDSLRLRTDRKSTRLNSSHLVTSYDVFCLKKKNTYTTDSVRQRCTAEMRYNYSRQCVR